MMKDFSFAIISLIILNVSGCSKDESPVLPLKLSFTIENVSTVGGADGSIDISVTGGKEPYTYLWSSGATTEDINNLAADEYSVKVTDADAESIEKSFVVTQPNETGEITDHEGNTYKTVKIGEQWWMAENLKTTTDSEGTPIDAYAYDDNESNVAKYGRLYTWDAAMAGCPTGWHLATDEEWKTLEMEVGMSETDANMGNTTNRGAGIAEILLKGGSSGFEAIYAGFWADQDNVFYDMIDRYCVFWTGTETTSDKAWARTMVTDKTTIYRFEDPKQWRMSVRCVKD